MTIVWHTGYMTTNTTTTTRTHETTVGRVTGFATARCIIIEIPGIHTFAIDIADAVTFDRITIRAWAESVRGITAEDAEDVVIVIRRIRSDVVFAD